jgi:hypothetical protein
MMALGLSINDIIALYRDHVPTVMKKTNADDRSEALDQLSKTIFGDAKFDAVKTNIEGRFSYV